MLKKIVQIGLVVVLFISMLIGNSGNLFATNKALVETSPISIPKTNAGDASALSVEETSEWTNTDLTKGNVNVTLKSAPGQGTELLKNQDIIFISDISGSMTGERIEQVKLALKQSATAFLDPALNNRVALASFDDRASIDYNLGNNYSEFETAVNNIIYPGKGGGGTSYEVGLKYAYDIINEQGEIGRTPVVIFMTDGNPQSLGGIDLYQKQIKALGATIYTVQYMNGSSIAPVLLDIATSADYAYNAIKTSYIADIYNSIVNKVISSKSYKNIETKFEIRNSNFSLKDVSVDVGTVSKSGNIITWTIPSLLSGTSVNLKAKVDLVDTNASGFLWTHQPGTVTYGVTDTNNETTLTLESTTLDRTMYNVKFDANGATSGATPDTFQAVATSMVNIPSNPKGLGCTGKVFLGWSISGTDGLVTGKTPMPNGDLTLKAEWGTPTISMNTDTIYVNLTHLDKAKFNTLATSVGATVKKVEFVGSINMGATPIYDLEVTGEESIKGWVNGDTLFVGSVGKIMAPTDCSNLFSPFKVATQIIFNGYFDTSEVTNMSGMFSADGNLSSLDLSTFDTSNVTDMSSMFKNQMSLSALTLTSFDTSKVTDMSNMFSNVSALSNVDVSSFNTSKVVNMSRMFADCANIDNLDLTSFTLESCTNLVSMFDNISSSKTVWVQSDEIKAIMDRAGSWNSPTIKVRAITINQTNNSISLQQNEVDTQAVVVVDADGLVDGGKVANDATINYKILVGFEAGTTSKSGVMKVTNIIPSDLTIDPSSIRGGAATWDVPGVAYPPTGSIYGERVDGNILTFYVKDLSANAKIDLTYEAKAPSIALGNYKEILNQSSLVIENVNLTSNFVRHFLGDDTVLPTSYPLTYTYDATAPSDAPALPKQRNYVAGQEVNVPSMSMSGYRFNGWTNNGVNVNSGIMAMPNMATTLVGSWTEIPPQDELVGTVKYEYQGAVPDDLEAPSLETYVVGNSIGDVENVSEKTITIPTPTAIEGYQFVGWQSTQLSADEINSGSFQLGHEEVTLVGVWEKQSYTVTYEYVAGSTIPTGAPTLPATQTVTWGEQVTTANKLVDVNGFTFDGWYSDSDIDPDFQSNFEMPKDNVVIYGYYTEKPYTITYQFDGDIPGDAISLVPSSSVGGALVAVWEVPASLETNKNGIMGTWQFNGWESKQVPSIVDGSFVMPDKDVVFVGTWTFTPNPNVRTISFEIENGRWADRTNTPINIYVELVHGKATLAADQVPTGMIANEGYTDGQWVVEPNTKVNGITGNVTYTFKFVKKPIVTFNVVNGTWADGTTIDQSIALEMINGKATLTTNQVPTGMIAKDGYTNGHWLVIPNIDMNGITQDITYTYVFDKIDNNGDSNNGGIDIEDTTNGDSSNSGSSNSGAINTGDETQFIVQGIWLSMSLAVILLLKKKKKRIND